MPSWGRMALAPTADQSYIVSGDTFSYLILNVDSGDAPTPRRHSS